MPELQPYPEVEYTLITDADGVAAAAEVLGQQNEAFALDTETTGLCARHDKLRLIQITIDGGHTVLIDAFATGPEALAPLWEVLADEAGPPVVMHNANFDAAFLWTEGCILPAKRIRCTLLQERCLTAGVTEPTVRGVQSIEEMEFLDLAELVTDGAGVKQKDLSVGLAAAVKRRLGLALPKEEQKSNWSSAELRHQQLVYAAKDPHSTLALYKAQLPLLEAEGLAATAQLENETVFSMVWMSLSGMPVNREAVPALRKHLLEEEGRLRTELLETLDAALIERGLPGLDRDIFGKVDETYCKPNHSPTFLEWLRRIGLDLEDLKKQTIALCPYLDHPVMQAQVGWKKAFSLSLYATKLASSIEPDGRVYCNFRQYGAGTGRMTSSQPINLQNIPRDGRFRDAFEAPRGFKAVVGDYPTVEPRLIAEVANDRTMLQSFRQGRDIYKTTAAALNDIDYDDVTPAQRKQAKPILLGLQYGMGANKLGRYAFLNYGVTLADPNETRDKFFNLYKGLKAWHRTIADAVEAATDYEARTPSGRRRCMSAATKSFSAAVNAPIQGGAADIMKRALVLLPQMILEAGLEETQLVSVVHDEVILIAADAEAEAAAAVLKAAMEAGAAEFLTIPLSVDVGIGPSWGAAKV